MTLRLEDIRREGLFPRQSGEHDFSRFEAFHQDRNVLVTGAGGSIGGALARAILHLRPSTLVVLDSSEQGLYHIDRELSRAAAKPEVVPVIGSVADRRCIADVFARLRPTIIYHAAALKHVPLGEQNPFAVVENNVFGTSVLANEAAQRGVERLIVISTDKSVNPQSIMGATKRLAETIVSTKSGPHTRMTSIRLGNVLGSEGSVVPLFLEQIARGEPVTVTDAEVERYFLTMNETVVRIFSATVDCPEQPATAVPIMEKPVKIVDLARLLIEQASVGSVEITFTRLAPGRQTT